MTNHIFSDLYDTVMQKELLGSRFSGDLNTFSEFYSDRFKIETLFLGKTVMTDAQFFDSTFLHGMSDVDLNGFFTFVGKNGCLEIRHRPDLIPNMLGKSFLFSSIPEQPLADAISQIGSNLRGKIEGDSMRAYFKAVEENAEGKLDSILPAYERFKNRLMQMDEWRGKLASLFVKWGTPRPEEIPDMRGYKDLPDVMKRERDKWIRFVQNKLVLNSDVQNAVLNELNKDYPNASIIKDLSDGSDQYKQFYRSFRLYYNIGLASQHFASVTEIAVVNDPDVHPEKGDLPLAARENHGEHRHSQNHGIWLPLLEHELNELIHSDWNDFLARYETDGLQPLRDDLWNAIRKNDRSDMYAALLRMRKTLGFPDTTDIRMGALSESIDAAGTSTDDGSTPEYEFSHVPLRIAAIKFYI